MKYKDIIQAKRILVQARKKVEAPKDETKILEWLMPELNAYIQEQTKGMNLHKKMKFGQELIKRIEEAKKLKKQ